MWAYSLQNGEMNEKKEKEAKPYRVVPGHDGCSFVLCNESTAFLFALPVGPSKSRKRSWKRRKVIWKKKQKASKNRRSTCRQMNTLKKWPEKSLVWSMMMRLYSKQSRIVSKSFFDTVLFLTTFEPLIRYT